MSKFSGHSDTHRDDSLTIVSTTRSSYSDSARGTARAHSAAWSRRRRKDVQSTNVNAADGVLSSSLPARPCQRRVRQFQGTLQQLRDLGPFSTGPPTGSGFLSTGELTAEPGGCITELDEGYGFVFSNEYESFRATYYLRCY